MLTGLEILQREGFRRLHGRRLGLLTNPSAVDRQYRHLFDLLRQAGCTVTTLFGPEHGVTAAAQDMVGVSGEKQAARVVSLYGDALASLRPPRETLEGLDAIVFDIQDVGSRYYTFVWTLAMMIEEAASAGVPVIVLDRPNPITAEIVEGGGIDPLLRSFVGYHVLPNRHGLTAGEIAAWVAKETPGARVEIVWMEGYDRRAWFDETGAPWVLPSPNMPAPETALVYPGQCLLEGTNLSEGRGTTRPFEICGAPFIDGAALAARMRAEDLPGAAFRPLTFRPMFHKWQGSDCGGVQIHVTSRAGFQPLRTSLALIRHVKHLWPEHFRWRTEKYEFRDDVPAFDLLTGSTAVRELIDSGGTVDRIMAHVASTARGALANRTAALHYR